MQTKVIPYGTVVEVLVHEATPKLLTVIGTLNSEGYFLVGHGVKPLPTKGDKGKITFTKGGPMNGYWKYTKQ